ncbi:hypothetical protein [Salipiger sp.]|uniref:hypothetical protein n=1 Tax=Salipiger sp. TaxID=2078585 RepID=UPI003A96971F
MLGFQGRLSEAQPYLEFAIARSIAPAPRYDQFLAMAYMMREDWEDMQSAASHAVADDSAFSHFLSAISHAMLEKVPAAKMDYRRLAERWPALAEDPRAAPKVHKVDTAFVDAFVAGLYQVHPRNRAIAGLRVFSQERIQPFLIHNSYSPSFETRLGTF